MVLLLLAVIVASFALNEPPETVIVDSLSATMAFPACVTVILFKATVLLFVLIPFVRNASFLPLDMVTFSSLFSELLLFEK